MSEVSASPKILLVEDDSVFRLLVKRLLGRDFAISEADCLQAARGQLASQSYSCALLDYRLPDGNGLQILPELVLLDLPVVMMTAMGHESLAVEAIKLGCQDYLVKDDLNRDTLVHSLSSAMQDAPSQRQAIRQRIVFPQIVQAATTQCRETTAALRELIEKAKVLPSHDLPHLDRLGNLMDGVLAYTKITSVDWSPEPVSVTSAVELAVQELIAAGIAIQTNLTSKPLPPVQSDPEAVRTIVRNLLDFAVQYVRPDQNPSITLQTMAVNLEACVQIELLNPTESNLVQTLHCLPEQIDPELEVSRLLIEKLLGRLWIEDAKDRCRIGFALPYQGGFDSMSTQDRL